MSAGVLSPGPSSSQARYGTPPIDARLGEMPTLLFDWMPPDVALTPGHGSFHFMVLVSRRAALSTAIVPFCSAQATYSVPPMDAKVGGNPLFVVSWLIPPYVSLASAESSSQLPAFRRATRTS